MEQNDRLVLLISTIGVLTDMIAGIAVDIDQDELLDALSALDYEAELLINTPLIRTMQILCEDFAKIEITDELLGQLNGQVNEPAE